MLIATDHDGPGEQAAVRLAALLGTWGARCERLRPSRKDWADDLAALGMATLSAQLAAVIRPPVSARS
jgi:hypothetical protein